jgi:hypothetical protein
LADFSHIFRRTGQAAPGPDPACPKCYTLFEVLGSQVYLCALQDRLMRHIFRAGKRKAR